MELTCAPSFNHELSRTGTRLVVHSTTTSRPLTASSADPTAVAARPSTPRESLTVISRGAIDRELCDLANAGEPPYLRPTVPAAANDADLYWPTRRERVGRDGSYRSGPSRADIISDDHCIDFAGS